MCALHEVAGEVQLLGMATARVCLMIQRKMNRLTPCLADVHSMRYSSCWPGVPFEARSAIAGSVGKSTLPSRPLFRQIWYSLAFCGFCASKRSFLCGVELRSASLLGSGKPDINVSWCEGLHYYRSRIRPHRQLRDEDSSLGTQQCNHSRMTPRLSRADRNISTVLSKIFQARKGAVGAAGLPPAGLPPTRYASGKEREIELRESALRLFLRGRTEGSGERERARGSSKTVGERLSAQAPGFGLVPFDPFLDQMPFAPDVRLGRPDPMSWRTATLGATTACYEPGSGWTVRSSFAKPRLGTPEESHPS